MADEAISNIENLIDKNNTDKTNITVFETSENDDIDLSLIVPESKYNKVIFEFDVEILASSQGLMLEYQFASNEYPNYVGSQFNDVFGYFISDPNGEDENIPDGDVNNNGEYEVSEDKAFNFARVPNKDIPVSINTINNGKLGSSSGSDSLIDLENSKFFIENESKNAVNFNGVTRNLMALSLLKVGVVYHVKMAISNTADNQLDSAVFISYIGGMPKIYLENDIVEVSSGKKLVINSVLINDIIEGEKNPNIKTLGLTQVSTTHDKIQLDTKTGGVNVLEKLPKGEYTLVYQVCKKSLNDCKQAKVTIIVKEFSELGSSKASKKVEQYSDGSFSEEFTIKIKNTGDKVLDNLSIIDDLTSGDNLGLSFVAIEETPKVTLQNTSGNSIALKANTSYDGSGDLLLGTDGSLYPGDIVAVNFRVHINPNIEGAPSNIGNIATVSGNDPTGKKVKDKTNSGEDPDKEPGEEEGEKTIVLKPRPEISLVKYAKNIDKNKNGLVDVGDIIRYTFEVKNTGDIDLKDIYIKDEKLANIENQRLENLGVNKIDTITFNGDYMISQEDIENGGVTNSAIVYGKDQSNQELQDRSDAGTDENNNKIKNPETVESGESDNDPTNDVTFTKIKSTDLKIYNTVSPNNDGHNDVFTIEGIENYSGNKVRIINRWGNVVFKTTNYKNTWNGFSNQKLVIENDAKVPAGTYFYFIDLNDGSELIKGWLKVVY